MTRHFVLCSKSTSKRIKAASMSSLVFFKHCQPFLSWIFAGFNALKSGHHTSHLSLPKILLVLISSCGTKAQCWKILCHTPNHPKTRFKVVSRPHRVFFKHFQPIIHDFLQVFMCSNQEHILAIHRSQKKSILFALSTTCDAKITNALGLFHEGKFLL